MEFEWRDCQLGDFVRLQRGHDLTALERTEGKYPVMGSAGQNGSHVEYKAHGPGVVIGRSGASAGRVHFCPVDYWPHNTCLYVTDFLGNDPRFAYYYLDILNLADYNSGSAQPSLNRNFIYTKSVSVPPPEAQREIAAFLGAIDDRIDVLRKTNATLEAIALAIFKSWFVDFDPVHAKAEGREPEGMDASTAALFPSEFEESELGLIPKGWTIAALYETFDINPRRSVAKGSPAPYLDMASVPTRGHVPALPIERDFSSGTKFKNGDTLLARITPCLENGKTAHVDFLREDQVGWGSTEFIVLRPKAPLPLYVGYLLARHAEFRNFAIQAMTGTSGRQRVELGQLKNYKFVYPDEPIALAFGNLVDSIRSSISANAKRAGVLVDLRDTLLPRLISGKLRLPEAEALIGAAAT